MLVRKLMKQGSRKLVILTGIILITGLLSWGLIEITKAAGFTPYNNRRFGFGVSYTGGEPTQYDIEPLNAGWFWDWSARTQSSLPELEYMRTIHTKPQGEDGYTISPTGTVLLDLIAANPGTTWLIGNEPDCVWMDNVRSEIYAQAYHDAYYFIKNADPTAKIAAGSIVQPTPQRMTYLDRVLAAYESHYGEPLPADLWAIHNYTLCENCWPYPKAGEPFAWGACRVPDWPSGSSMDTFYSVEDHYELEHFAERIIVMREWMAEHGYRNMPLIITEYGILFYDGLVKGKTAQDTIDFMNTTFDWMRTARDPEIGFPADDGKLVQRWAWFSLDHDGWYMGGELFDYRTHEPEALADAYGAYTDQVMPEMDLLTVDSNAVVIDQQNVAVTINNDYITATIDVTVANAGNIEMQEPITVGLYTGLTNMTLITETTLSPLGCCGDFGTATLTWRNVQREQMPEYTITARSGLSLTAEPLTGIMGVQLALEKVWSPMIITPTQLQPVTATLYADIVNHGNLQTNGPVTVTFYIPGTSVRVIDQVMTSKPLKGVSQVNPNQNRETVTTTLSGLTTGGYDFCVEAYTANETAETVCSFVWVNPPYEQYLPLINKGNVARQVTNDVNKVEIMDITEIEYFRGFVLPR